MHFRHIAILELTVSMSSLFFGCASAPKRIQEQTLPPEFVDDRNYTIGKSLEVNVGDTMVRRRKYVLQKSIRRDVATPDRDCVVYAKSPIAGKSETQFRKGYGVRLGGEIKVDGQSCVLLPINRLPLIGPGVQVYAPINVVNKKAFGTVSWTNAFGQTNTGTVTVEPIGTLFEPYVEEKVIEPKGQAMANSTYVNFDITYTGTSNNQVNLVYREYDKLDRARTAFFQNLQYQVVNGKAKIQFRDISMLINNVNNQSINFTVLKDDNDDPEGR